MQNFILRIKTFLWLWVITFFAFIRIFIPYIYRTLNESMIITIKDAIKKYKTFSSGDKT